jgi:uncharacterized protein
MYNKPFKNIDSFKPSKYELLPFDLEIISETNVHISNMLGEYLTLSKEHISELIEQKLEIDSRLYKELKRKFFIFDDTDEINTVIDLLSTRFRTKNQLISNFTGLHIFVVSLRCEHSCSYCQVSRQNVESVDFDMTEEIALKAIDLMFKSPSPSLKVEFQGGEPLLNFKTIQFVVNKAKERNAIEKRDIAFVIATNLALVDDAILEFCKEHGVLISTSLDGPSFIHNKNRYRPGNDSHMKAVEGIKKVRSVLGYDRVGALMTTTALSLKHPKEIINEYLANGFNSIFLRPISPYGFAVKGTKANQDLDEWLEFYFKGLEYIIELNKNGIKIREDYASIILSKIYGSRESGYVDLQNPAGLGISAVVYNYDAKLYASDEGRMLKEMGVEVFCLGDIRNQTYEELFANENFLEILERSVLESSPECYQCAYRQYCGSDPVYHFATQGDFTGNKSRSGFCKKNKTLFKKLIELYENDLETRSIFQSWFKRD